ncbi:ionotropic receptor 25a-like [Macrosteles quadrilineatus]|uniref:ionotropic receptor 25a-like n=1 Tax=Macrosteles quadrilineatus TaxID=74068 RepID=UPI0023E14569|nr:ionotropic receptor 25a-like [Macrosteles quadrilineatus]
MLTQRRLANLKEKWWEENPARITCKSQDSFTDERTYLTNIGGVYSLIIMGLLLAFFTLVFEYYNPKDYRSQAPSSNSSKGPHSSSLPFQSCRTENVRYK